MNTAPAAAQGPAADMRTGADHSPTPARHLLGDHGPALPDRGPQRLCNSTMSSYRYRPEAPPSHQGGSGNSPGDG